MNFCYLFWSCSVANTLLAYKSRQFSCGKSVIQPWATSQQFPCQKQEFVGSIPWIAQPVCRLCVCVQLCASWHESCARTRAFFRQDKRSFTKPLHREVYQKSNGFSSQGPLYLNHEKTYIWYTWHIMALLTTQFNSRRSKQKNSIFKMEQLNDIFF